MTRKTLLITMIVLSSLTGCAPSTPPPPTPTQPLPATATSTLFIATNTPAASAASQTPGAFTPIPGLTSTPVPGATNICADPQATALIDSLKSAMLTSDGTLLSSLVSPPRGLDASYLRDGTVINYTPDQAKFLFETTFEVKWGAEPGSGAEKTGSFHDVIVPELVKAFNQNYTLHCNELKHGGASYEVTWPYKGDFYSVYFAGTEANGLLDWHTWAVGVEYVNGKPYIYALMQFFWEP